MIHLEVMHTSHFMPSKEQFWIWASLWGVSCVLPALKRQGTLFSFLCNYCSDQCGRFSLCIVCLEEMSQNSQNRDSSHILKAKESRPYYGGVHITFGFSWTVFKRAWMQHSCCCFPLLTVSMCLCEIAGSLADGRWTAWPWRDKRTMAFPCLWTPSSSRPLGSWAGGPVLAPSQTTLSGNTGPTSCSLLHWEVNKEHSLWLSLLLLTCLKTWITRWCFRKPDEHSLFYTTRNFNPLMSKSSQVSTIILSLP